MFHVEHSRASAIGLPGNKGLPALMKRPGSLISSSGSAYISNGLRKYLAEAESFVRFGDVSGIGILRCAQNDGRNRKARIFSEAGLLSVQVG
jgi:hypothetical protein